MDWSKETNERKRDLFKNGRILYASSVDISLPKGPSVNEREFCWGLHKLLGDRISYLIPTPRKNINELLEYQVHFLKKCDYRNPCQFLLHQMDFSKKFRYTVASKKFDIIVTRLGLLPIGFYIGVQALDIPFVIKHLTASFDLTSIEDNKIIKYIKRTVSIMSKAVTSKIVKTTLAVDTPTMAHFQAIVRSYKMDPDAIMLIENAINTARFRLIDKYAARAKCSLDRFDPIIGYVGGRPWERGGEEMLSVAPKIIKRFPNAGFVIVGGGNGLDPLVKRIHKAGLGKYFHCPGIVDYDDVPVYINAFDIGIAFPRAYRFNLVGNSNQKIRQYIACGKPVVTTPGDNDFITNNKLGSVVNTKDIEGIVDALLRWLSLNENERKNHAYKSVAFARENFSIEKAVSKRIEFWNYWLGKKTERDRQCNN